MRSDCIPNDRNQCHFLCRLSVLFFQDMCILQLQCYFTSIWPLL